MDGLILALVLGGFWRPAAVHAGGPPPPPPPTACVNLCGPDLPDPCVLTFGIVVTAGSDIDCGDREVIIDSPNGALTVHDGRFTLRARTLRVRGSGHLTADCPTGTPEPGFRLHATQDLFVEGNGRLRADCAVGGGVIVAQVGGNITAAGNGITADGAALGARGGTIQLTASGTIGVGAAVSASAFDAQDSTARGGTISLAAGGTIATTGQLRAQGVNATGGSITVDSAANVTLTGHGLADALRRGDGGRIEIRGRDLLTTGRLVAKGVLTGSTGGGVDLDAEGKIDIRNDIVAKGDKGGGSIGVHAEGPVTIGQSGTSAFELTVSSSSSGSAGGDLVLVSEGDEVRIFAKLTATDGTSGGEGGHIQIEGASVTADASSTIKADATGQGTGGEIAIVAREQMVLNGWLRASGGDAVFVYRDTPPAVGPSVYPPWEQRQEADLSPACGDTFLRAGEQCDELNLGEDVNGNPNTCQSLGYGGGTLDCTATCTFDTSGCTP